MSQSRSFAQVASLASWLVLVILIFAGDAQSVIQSNFRRCSYNASFNQVAVPPTLSQMASQTGVSWGVSLNNSLQTIEQYSAAIQQRPEIVNTFLNFTNASISSVAIDCEIASVRAAGAALMLTIEPWTGLDNITTPVLSALTTLCTQANQQGVPILLRFAQEMNGDWYPWGASPTLYVAAFRQIATAIKAATNMTQMLWAPNTAVGYPFNSTNGYGPKSSADPRFAQIDTNGNGVFDSGDDPYLPYYPGDDVVDWVGVSLYSKRNNAVSSDMANVQNTRANFSFWITDGTAGFDLYQNFSSLRNKPFMVAETGAAYYPEYPDGDGAVVLKQTWWNLLWSSATLTAYPNMKAVMWFEYIKTSTDSSEVLDYTITQNTTILDPFLSDTTAAQTNVRFLQLSSATALAATSTTTGGATPIATVTQLTSIPPAASSSAVIVKPNNGGNGSASHPSTNNSSAASAASSGDSSSGYNSTGSNMTTTTIAIAVAVPVGVILLFGLCGLMCRRRAKRNVDKSPEQRKPMLGA